MKSDKDYRPRLPSMSASEHLASSDGAAAGKSGYKSTANPHPAGSPEHRAWHKAHSAAFMSHKPHVTHVISPQNRIPPPKKETVSHYSKESTNPLIDAAVKSLSEQSPMSDQRVIVEERDSELETDHSGKFWHHIERAYKSVSVSNAQRHSKKALEHAAQHFIKTGQKIDAEGLVDGLPSGHEHYLKY